MKAGRYFRGSEIRLFFVDSEASVFDWDALDCRRVPGEVRNAARNAVRSGRDKDLLLALPRIEEWLAGSAGSWRECDHAAVLPAEILKLPIPPPIRPQKFICVGLNYRDHARESKMEVPVRPLLFAKTSNAVN